MLIIYQTPTKTLFMNIEILSLSLNQNGIEYTWSNNGGDESEIEKMSKEDFAKLLCEHGDDIYEDKGIYYSKYVSEDRTEWALISTRSYIESTLKDEPDYCKECLVKHIQSQNKN